MLHMQMTPVGSRHRYLKVLPVILLLLLCFISCRQVVPPDVEQRPICVPAEDFNQLFERSGPGWTGGDGTLSVWLPDDRTLWLFGDTLLGRVAADGTRPLDTPFVHNSLVVQDGSRLETRVGSVRGEPGAFFSPSSAEEWFWPGHGVVVGARLKIFLHRFEQTAPELWAWRWVGTNLAHVSLPSLNLTGIQAAPSDNQILYGVCLMESDGYTYIYGTADQCHPKEAHVARVPAGRLEGPWDYFNGACWSGQAVATCRILAGVSTQYSVIRFGRHFYLFTMDGRDVFSYLIVVYRAVHPQGPWQGPLTLYEAPEAGDQVIAYNPFAHPQFLEENRVLLSYNLNHVSNPDALYRDAAIYRPRFIRVDLGEADRRFDGEAPRQAAIDVK